MKAQAALIADDPVFLNWLQDSLDASLELHWVRPGDSTDPALDQIRRLSPLDIVFVQVSEHDLSDALIERILENCHDTVVVAVGTQSDADLVIGAMRAGARDFLVLGRDDGELRNRLGKILRRASSATRTQAAPGRMVSLLAASPFENLAWAAQHLALATLEAGVPGERVLLVDAGMPSGASLVFLNLTQSYSLLDAVQDVYRCDQTLIDTAFASHPSGLSILALPEDQIGPVSLDEGDFLGLLDVLSGFFGHVFVAAGTHLPLSLLSGLVRNSHASVLLADPSIVNSRANKHLLQALRLENCPLDRTGIVIDQPVRKLGLAPANLAQLLDMPLWGTLNGQLSQRLQAMNSGEALFKRAPRDAYCDDIRRLADRLRSDSPASSGTALPRKSLLGSLFGD